MARTIRKAGVREVPLSEVKDDLSRYLREAETEEIIITRHGKPAGVLIGFESEDDWFDYRLENDPRFLRRIEQARASARAGLWSSSGRYRGIAVAARSTLRTVAKTQTKQLVVCIDNEGYATSLEKRKIYIALRDAAAEKHGLLRIVDETGEDYLYPKKSFRPIALPLAVKRAVLAA
jgi:prevent-host-death family protein